MSAEGLLSCALQLRAGQEVEAVAQGERLGGGVWRCLHPFPTQKKVGVDGAWRNSTLSSGVSFGHPQGARYIYRCSHEPG